MADALHAWAKYGLNVTIQYIQSSNAALTNLISGQIDALMQGVAGVITANLNGHAELAFVASGLNHSQFSFYAPPSISSSADLKGKVIANDQPGTPVDYGTHLCLSLMKLQPSDVQLRTIGGPETMFPAMSSGQVFGACLSPPFTFLAQDQGLRDLQDTFQVPYQNVGIVVRKPRLAELGSVMPGVLAGYRDGITAYNAQPDRALQVLQQFTQNDDASINQRTYDFYRSTAPFETDLQPTAEGTQSILDFLGAGTLPAAANAKPSDFIDTRYLSQLPTA